MLILQGELPVTDVDADNSVSEAEEVSSARGSWLGMLRGRRSCTDIYIGSAQRGCALTQEGGTDEVKLWYQLASK